MYILSLVEYVLYRGRLIIFIYSTTRQSSARHCMYSTYICIYQLVPIYSTYRQYLPSDDDDMTHITAYLLKLHKLYLHMYIRTYIP